MNDTYYERNKEKIKKNKVIRYSIDADYRSGVKKTVARAQKKAGRRKKSVVKTEWKIFTLNMKGKSIKVQACTIGYLAASIGRTVQTIRLWEKQGFLPTSIRYNNRRYYTVAQYQLILKMWDKYNGNLERFYNEVIKKWRY